MPCQRVDSPIFSMVRPPPKNIAVAYISISPDATRRTEAVLRFSRRGRNITKYLVPEVRSEIL